MRLSAEAPPLPGGVRSSEPTPLCGRQLARLQSCIRHFCGSNRERSATITGMPKRHSQLAIRCNTLRSRADTLAQALSHLRARSRCNWTTVTRQRGGVRNSTARLHSSRHADVLDSCAPFASMQPLLSLLHSPCCSTELHARRSQSQPRTRSNAFNAFDGARLRQSPDGSRSHTTLLGAMECDQSCSSSDRMRTVAVAQIAATPMHSARTTLRYSFSSKLALAVIQQ